MPSLLRFLVIVAILGAAAYGGLWALATMVEPEPREMTITIPTDRLAR